MPAYYIYYQQENGDLIDIDAFCSAICREDYMRNLRPSRNYEFRDESDPDKSGWSSVTLPNAYETDYCEYCVNPACGDLIRHGLECDHDNPDE